jgi:hypothetical protein
MEKLKTFAPPQVEVVKNAAAMAEELVSDFFKMSASQWLKRRYDIKTSKDLSKDEIIQGPFAQIIRYSGRRRGDSLGSSVYDFYKICVQDHSILAVLDQFPGMRLFPFALYIIIHELIHIIRFSRFLQNFDASPDEIHDEEVRVHELTADILKGVQTPRIREALEFYRKWRAPLESSRL